MKQLALSLFIFSLLYIVYISDAHASGCQPIYGGGEICTSSISVTKEIYDATNNVFVHNLGVADTKFKINDLIPFRITVTNTGTTAINQIILKDIFPSGIVFSAGAGSFNQATNTVTAINNTPLAPSGSMTFGLIGRVLPTFNFDNQTTVCVSNQATATTDANETAQDSSQFCLQKTVISILPPTTITQTPPTGVNQWIFAGLAGMASIGIFLRKKAGA